MIISDGLTVAGLWVHLTHRINTLQLVNGITVPRLPREHSRTSTSEAASRSSKENLFADVHPQEPTEVPRGSESRGCHLRESEGSAHTDQRPTVTAATTYGRSPLLGWRPHTAFSLKWEETPKAFLPSFLSSSSLLPFQVYFFSLTRERERERETVRQHPQ